MNEIFIYQDKLTWSNPELQEPRGLKTPAEEFEQMSINDKMGVVLKDMTDCQQSGLFGLPSMERESWELLADTIEKFLGHWPGNGCFSREEGCRSCRGRGYSIHWYGSFCRFRDYYFYYLFFLVFIELNVFSESVYIYRGRSEQNNKLGLQKGKISM